MKAFMVSLVNIVPRDDIMFYEIDNFILFYIYHRLRFYPFDKVINNHYGVCESFRGGKIYFSNQLHSPSPKMPWFDY